MSLLNMLSKSGIFDQLGAMTRESPDLARAASSLLSSSDTSVGGSGGLLNVSFIKGEAGHTVGRLQFLIDRGLDLLDDAHRSAASQLRETAGKEPARR